ncbi:MAG: hypothetical protein NTX03_13160 [Bacteroidetes bacterium]|nr:hypothetical protein [Bacteroidota bacterium]
MAKNYYIKPIIVTIISSIILMSCSTHRTAYKLEKGPIGFKGGTGKSTLTQSIGDLQQNSVLKKETQLQIQEKVAEKKDLSIGSNSLNQEKPSSKIKSTTLNFRKRLASTILSLSPKKVTTSYKKRLSKKLLKPTDGGFSSWDKNLQYLLYCGIAWAILILIKYGFILLAIVFYPFIFVAIFFNILSYLCLLGAIICLILYITKSKKKE